MPPKTSLGSIAPPCACIQLALNVHQPGPGSPHPSYLLSGHPLLPLRPIVHTTATAITGNAFQQAPPLESRENLRGPSLFPGIRKDLHSLDPATPGRPLSPFTPFSHVIDRYALSANYEPHTVPGAGDTIVKNTQGPGLLKLPVCGVGRGAKEGIDMAALAFSPFPGGAMLRPAAGPLRLELHPLELFLVAYGQL